MTKIQDLLKLVTEFPRIGRVNFDDDTHRTFINKVLTTLKAAKGELDAVEVFNSPTGPYVLAFAKLMEQKLAANRHKGNRESWIKDSWARLRFRLDQELDELDEAIDRKNSVQEIANEAADIANFAMMIADTVAAGPWPTSQCPGYAPSNAASPAREMECSTRILGAHQNTAGTVSTPDHTPDTYGKPLSFGARMAAARKAGAAAQKKPAVKQARRPQRRSAASAPPAGPTATPESA